MSESKERTKAERTKAEVASDLLADPELLRGAMEIDGARLESMSPGQRALVVEDISYLLELDREMILKALRQFFFQEMETPERNKFTQDFSQAVSAPAAASDRDLSHSPLYTRLKK